MSKSKHGDQTNSTIGSQDTSVVTEFAMKHFSYSSKLTKTNGFEACNALGFDFFVDGDIFD
jgi:hypothetical protein